MEKLSYRWLFLIIQALMKKPKTPLQLESIAQMHRVIGLPEPQHPLISIVNFSEMQHSPADFTEGFVLNFYMVAIKKDFKGKIRYGQSYYDFDEGVMSFISPGQICYEDEPSDRPGDGYMLLFHADFLRGYTLDSKIKDYEFFTYKANEALYLSKKEEEMIEGIFTSIKQEYNLPIDHYSQDVMVSHIELLLNYANRFYNRQFITRKLVNNSLVSKLEEVLRNHFDNEAVSLPKVKDVAAQLNVSPQYLSDMLRAHTGLNAQQHIHNKLIDKAKEILSSTELTVSEIAYQLGFEYPQSFSKLFKSKESISPLEYRRLFN